MPAIILMCLVCTRTHQNTMQQFLDFFDTPVFYLIMWVICGVCFFIFRKNYKVDNTDIYTKAEEVNKDKIGQFFLNKLRNQGNSSLLAPSERDKNEESEK